MDKTICLNIDLCSGCGACVVACMDQNDIYPEKGQVPFRRIYCIEDSEFPEAEIKYISTGCLHCEDSPCVIGCPTGAITKDDKTRAVIVNSGLCIGCHSCALSCPFGVPRFNRDGKMEKCNLCLERLEAGLEPACVRVCPTFALTFESPNKFQETKESKFVLNFLSSISKPLIEK